MESIDRLNRLSELDQDLAPKVNWNLNVSRDRNWITPEMSHLQHLEVFSKIPADLRLRYNQFFAMLVIEQISAFEKDVLVHVDRRVFRKFKASPDIPANLKISLDHFVREEAQHVEMFEKLLTKCRTALGLEKNFQVFTVNFIQNQILKFFFSLPNIFVFWIWVVLFVEERTLLIARLMNKDKTNYDPLHLQVQNAHLRDESRHVQLDEYLLELCWDPAPMWLRKLNVKLLQAFLSLTFVKSLTAKKLWMKFLEHNPEGAVFDSEVQAQLPGLPKKRAYIDQFFAVTSAPRFWKMLNSREEMEPVREYLLAFRDH